MKINGTEKGNGEGKASTTSKSSVSVAGRKAVLNIK